MFVPLSVLEFRDRAATFFGDKIGVIDGERAVHLPRSSATRTHRLANALVELGVEPRRPGLVHHLQHPPPARGLLRRPRGGRGPQPDQHPPGARTRSPTSSTTPARRSSSSTATSRRSSRRSRPQLTTRPTFVVLDGEPGGIADHEYEALLAGGLDRPAPPGDRRERDGRALLHERHDRPAQGRGDDPPRAVPAQPRTPRSASAFTEDDVVLHVVPLFHVNGWGTPHFLTMIGGRHVMLRRFDPRRADGRSSSATGSPACWRCPTIFNAVLNQPRAAELRPVEPAPADHRRLARLARRSSGRSKRSSASRRSSATG